MGLVSPQKISLDISGNVKGYYKSLGYDIPEYYNKNHKEWFTPEGTKILVDVKDLSPNSNFIIDVECDICGKVESISMMEYTRIKSYIRKYGYDCLCMECKFNVSPTAKLKVGTCKEDAERVRRFLIKKLTSYIDKNGYPLSMRKNFKPENDLPTARIYRENLRGDLVDWIEMCGFKLSEDEKYKIRHRGGKGNISKEDCVDRILKMQSKLDRPLKTSDFKASSEDSIGISIVTKYWGSLNKMKQELGLIITQESMMDKQLSKDDFDSTVQDICKFVLGENRDFITTKEINNNTLWSNYGTLIKYSKKYYRKTLNDILKD